MIEINGAYSKAKIFADEIEETAKNQIIQLVNHPISKNAHIRIMPDVHAGLGCVIGYTAYLGDMVIPNLIGVDIGCGVLAFCFKGLDLGKSDFVEIDNIIRKNIPSGTKVRCSFSKNVYEVSKRLGLDFDKFEKKLERIAKKTNQDINYVLNSIGTLGSGNHFIEIDKSDKNICFVVHSGSRNFGLSIANYHQKKAKKVCRDNVPKGMEYLVGIDAKEYMEDMKTAQIFAKLNRYTILHTIIKEFVSSLNFETIESVHNYINFDDKIVRKGAISAHKGERVIIPLNMAEGVVVGIGKGNNDWNMSAPHGAGRLMSRKQAKKSLSLNEFKNSMKSVFSTCVNKKTIDESPMAYKDKDYILNKLKENVDVLYIAKPIYNFKAV